MGGGFKIVLAVTPNLEYPGRGLQRLISSQATKREAGGTSVPQVAFYCMCVRHHEPSCSQLGEDTFYGLTVKAMPVATHFVTFNGHQICSVIDFL